MRALYNNLNVNTGFVSVASGNGVSSAIISANSSDWTVQASSVRRVDDNYWRQQERAAAVEKPLAPVSEAPKEAPPSPTTPWWKFWQ